MEKKLKELEKQISQAEIELSKADTGYERRQDLLYKIMCMKESKHNIEVNLNN